MSCMLSTYIDTSLLKRPVFQANLSKLVPEYQISLDFAAAWNDGSDSSENGNSKTKFHSNNHHQQDETYH